jgi:uncharacterized cofD-like protein
MNKIMKKIIVIGGGSGIFNVLKGLKNYPVSITSIVTTFDNGGSTGILRDEFGTLPQGDIRRSLVALSPDTGDSTIRDLFNFRFPKESSLHGHSFGNLFLQALTSITGSDVSAIKKAADILNIKNKILPISIDNAQLCAKLEDGEIIKGETNIDIPKHDGSIKIKEVYLEPKAIIYREAYDEIVNADLIIIGPGDLYTSILPNTLVEGFSDAIKNSKAKIVYILNVMTKWGETNNFKASDFLKTLLSYAKIEKIDYIICNNSPINSKLEKKYKLEKSEQIEIDEEELKKYSNNIIKDDVSLQTDIIRHDPIKISKIIMNL